MSSVVRADARRPPLRPGSANLVIVSFPYWDQRLYEDGGVPYPGQIGNEETAAEYLESLWACVRVLWDLLADDGVLVVNMGDKRSGSGAPGTTSGLTGRRAGGSIAGQVQGERSRIAGGYKSKSGFGRPKSKMMLPHRFAIGCMDGRADPCVLDHDHDADAVDCRGIGWIVRSDIVWDKPNGMPESATDRTRDNTENWFLLAKNENYYAATVEIREPPSDYSRPTSNRKTPPGQRSRHMMKDAVNPLGRIPGSVWRIPTGGPRVPDYLVEDESGVKLLDREPLWRYVDHRLRTGNRAPVLVREVDHYAAFPTEWPRRIILAWSPPGICTVCGEGRRPVVDKPHYGDFRVSKETEVAGRSTDGPERNRRYKSWKESTDGARILGYACSCCPRTIRGGGVDPEPPRLEYHLDRWDPPPTRPAVVVDTFGGTGTTAVVADALGRFGVSMDMSRDYSLIARWRLEESGDQARVRSRTDGERQVSLFD